MFSRSFLKDPALKPYVVIFKSTEVIFWEGDIAQHFYIILEGQVEIRRVKSDGNHLVMAVMKSGEFFGEMALMNNLPRTATALAREKCKLLVLTQDQLLAVVSEDAQFGLKMIKMLCERLKAQGDMLVQV